MNTKLGTLKCLALAPTADWQSMGVTLQCHPFLGLVDLADELLHTP